MAVPQTAVVPLASLRFHSALAHAQTATPWLPGQLQQGLRLKTECHSTECHCWDSISLSHLFVTRCVCGWSGSDEMSRTCIAILHPGDERQRGV
eukprot:355968-Chlamydomonas_euryale.AAC.3